MSERENGQGARPESEKGSDFIPKKIVSPKEFLDEIGHPEISGDELSLAIRGDDTVLLGDYLPAQPQPKAKEETEKGRVSGIFVADEAFGKPVTVGYFEEAMDFYIKAQGVGKEKGMSPEAKLQFCLRDNRERNLKVVITEEGKEAFLRGMDPRRLREGFMHPEQFDGEKIGSGSEGDVYIYRIEGKEYAIKIYSKEAQERVNNNPLAMMTRTSYRKPDFTERIGYTEAAAKEMREWPIESMTITGATDYVATQNYIITELGPRISVKDLFSEEGANPSAVSFLQDNKIKKEHLATMKEEIELITKLASVLDYKGVGFFGKKQMLQTDFNLDNFLVRGYDGETGVFDIVLIDQGTESPLSSRENHSVELQNLDWAQKDFEELVKVPRYREYLEELGIKEIKGDWET